MSVLETHWTKYVLMPMDANEPKVNELEQFRRQLGLPHKDFAGLVMGSAAYFRMSIEGMAGGFRNEFWTASDRQIIAAVAILCSHLDLQKTKGVFTIEALMHYRERFRGKIDAAIHNPDPLLEKLQVRSLDALAAKLFSEMGTYEKCHPTVRDLFLQVDTILGWKYRLDYDELWDGLTSLAKDELQKQKIMQEVITDVVKLTLEKQKIMQDFAKSIRKGIPDRFDEWIEQLKAEGLDVISISARLGMAFSNVTPETQKIDQDFAKTIEKVMPDELNECIERLNAGEDFDVIAGDISARLGIGENDFQVLFILWQAIEGTK